MHIMLSLDRYIGIMGYTSHAQSTQGVYKLVADFSLANKSILVTKLGQTRSIQMTSANNQVSGTINIKECIALVTGSRV